MFAGPVKGNLDTSLLNASNSQNASAKLGHLYIKKVIPLGYIKLGSLGKESHHKSPRRLPPHCCCCLSN